MVRETYGADIITGKQLNGLAKRDVVHSEQRNIDNDKDAESVLAYYGITILFIFESSTIYLKSAALRKTRKAGTFLYPFDLPSLSHF